MRKGLFIGRFQPFHNGHLHVVRLMMTEVDRVIIGIGSSQYSNVADNPFTSEERREMISKIVDADIIEIPDIHNYPKWVEHVCNIVDDFDVVYTGNKLVQELFEEKGHTVVFIEHIGNISATLVREMIAGGMDVSSMVPSKVIEYLESIGGFDRIKQLLNE